MWSPQFSIRLKPFNPQEAQLHHRQWEKSKFQPSLWTFQLKGVDQLSSAQGDPSWPEYHQSETQSAHWREHSLLPVSCSCSGHGVPITLSTMGTRWGQRSPFQLPLATPQGQPLYYLATNFLKCTWEWTPVPIVTKFLGHCFSKKNSNNS